MNYSDNITYKIPRELEGKLNQTQERILGRIMVLTKLGEKGYCILSSSDLKKMGISKSGRTNQSIQELIDMKLIHKKVCVNKKSKIKETRYWLNFEKNTADWLIKKQSGEEQDSQLNNEELPEDNSESLSDNDESFIEQGEQCSPYQSEQCSQSQSEQSSRCFNEQGEQSSPTKVNNDHIHGEQSSPSTFINICDPSDINMCEGDTHKKTASNDQDFLSTSEEKKSEDSKPKTLADLVKSKEPYKSTQTPDSNIFSFPRSEVLAQEPACYEEVYEYLDEYKTNFKTQFPAGTFDKVDVSEVAGVFWRKNSAKKWRNKNDWRTEAINWFERQRRYIAEHPEKFKEKSNTLEIDKDLLDEIANIDKRPSYGS